MIKVAFIGWRGLVGSTLIKRILETDEFKKINPYFYISSNTKKKKLYIKKKKKSRLNSYSIDKLFLMDIIMSCQGKLYTKVIHRLLRKKNWEGLWLDSSSELRMNNNSTIVLDPVNKDNIYKSLLQGKEDFIGGNCTVSLMLMVVHNLITKGLVEWITSTTYQSVSGGGSNKINEMFSQMRVIDKKINKIKYNKKISLYKVEKILMLAKKIHKFSIKKFGTNIIHNLIPWIDKLKNNGQTKEEVKSFDEANKIMNIKNKNLIKIDSQCVRIDTIRCHSQSLIIKLKKNIPIGYIKLIIKNSNKWIKIIPNKEKHTVNKLNPCSISGSLNIYVGRIRKMKIGNKFLNIFTIGDQLLWGGAEPLRRALNILTNYIYSKNKK